MDRINLNSHTVVILAPDNRVIIADSTKLMDTVLQFPNGSAARDAAINIARACSVKQVRRTQKQFDSAPYCTMKVW